MGIYHFSPVGLLPGAVTSALAYLKRHPELKPKHGKDEGDIIQSVIIFASHDVREGTETLQHDCIYNRYGSDNGIRPYNKGTGILEAILDFIKKEFGTIAVYCSALNPNDYGACFESIAKATLKFAPPDHVGKNIWANLTGGTNVMNAALFQVASLSGLISQLYYTFVPYAEDRKYLQPRHLDYRFQWNKIPLFKTSFDDIYHLLLKMLYYLPDGWYLDEEILARLRQKAWENLPQVQAESIGKMDIQIFRREYLNKMDGWELERQLRPDGSQSNSVRISENGRKLLGQIESPLFQALVQRGKGAEADISEILDDFELEQLL